MKPQKPILFFDGHCNLCNNFIDTLVRWDKKQRILIAPLQGKTAAQKLPAEQRETLDSVVLFDQGKLYIKSSAIFRVARLVKGPFLLLLPFWIIPRFFTNWIYDAVALSRYSLFGRRESCRLPTEKEKQHFLE